ncbi:hypothetical protein [Nocardioides sp. GXQ0305]|uniref:hypothetical protein n=1 Tax=Nocardioides sp. GXQ0305 TaxID=3423912 RepID=UPI003D7C5E0D
MGWTLGVGIGVALGLAVLAGGVRLILRGRREGRVAAADADDRMVASLRVAAGVRMLNKGGLLLVLVAIAAFVWR